MESNCVPLGQKTLDPNHRDLKRVRFETRHAATPSSTPFATSTPATATTTMSLKDATEKPDIADFRLDKQIGEGNFSRIVKATYKPTSEVFALKIVEKQRVKRLRIRHANILNEITMEKDVLNALRHPNVIRLFHTFQDVDNLYFLLEYLDGGELLEHIVYDSKQVGFHEDMARFYLADIVNAVEYLHAQHVLHRDLKPENMVVDTATQHLKLIDFGTAKRLKDTSLNGPNFVGTPEYMAPETIDNKDATTASDVWAIGCILFQLLTGETPFSGGSAYLTFLQVQDGRFTIPAFVSDEARDLICKLLLKDPTQRLTIDEIKAHAFFSGIDFANHMQAPLPSTKFANIGLLNLAKQLKEAEAARDKTSDNPLAIPADDPLQARIAALAPRDRSLLMHLLKRFQVLQCVGIYVRFFPTPSAGRCRFATDGRYVGLTHDLQHEWADRFTLVQVAGPQLGRAAALDERDTRGGSHWDVETAAFRRVIAAINATKPAFVVVCGDFVYANPHDECFLVQLQAFQELVHEIQSEIHVVLVPGHSRVNTAAACTAYLQAYEEHFGDVRYSLWFGGMKLLVLNSMLLRHPTAFATEIKQQDEWLQKELENGKLCARSTAVLTFEPLASKHHSTTATTVSESNNSEASVNHELLPAAIRGQYVARITAAHASLLATAHPLHDATFHIFAPHAHSHSASKSSDEEDDNSDEDDEQDDAAHPHEHACHVLACKTPSTTTDVIHTVHVKQNVLTLEQLRLDDVASSSSSSGNTDATAAQSAVETKAVVAADAAPENDAASSNMLSLDSVTLDIAA